MNRRVCAPGFKETAFEDLLKKRYHWMQRLGNARIGTEIQGIRIQDPFAVKLLLEAATEAALDNRRIIFFCACEIAKDCHRTAVAELLIKHATEIGQPLEVMEWPGGDPSPLRTKLKVTDDVFRKLTGHAKNLPLTGQRALSKLLCLPWGSLVYVQCGKESAAIVSGPANYDTGRTRWQLPVHRLVKRGSTAGQAELEEFVTRFRKNQGVVTRAAVVSKGNVRMPLRALSVRQPWAHAIVHLGNDVENRSRKGQYRGWILIHASGEAAQDGQRRLSKCVTNPPSEQEIADLPKGCIVGVAQLYDYVENSKSIWAHKGSTHWMLRNARPIQPPVACKGALGLWKPSEEVMQKLPSWVRKMSVHDAATV